MCSRDVGVTVVNVKWSRNMIRMPPPREERSERITVHGSDPVMKDEDEEIRDEGIFEKSQVSGMKTKSGWDTVRKVRNASCLFTIDLILL